MGLLHKFARKKSNTFLKVKITKLLNGLHSFYFILCVSTIVHHYSLINKMILRLHLF